MDQQTQTNGNGKHLSKDRLQDVLTAEPLTRGYLPTLPQWALEADWLPQIYILRDIELMLIHPQVRNALNYYKGGIAGADFEIKCPNTKVAEFGYEQCKRFWDRGVPGIQGGYEYGWIGVENLYDDSSGVLAWNGIVQFSPRDVFLLTQRKTPVGVRVKNVSMDRQDSAFGSGQIDLWLSTPDVPAKGLWYAHNPRYHSFYGQSQLIGAWRPWRRVAWKDGAETVLDTGCYRFAFCGPVIRFPSKDDQAPPAGTSPATTLDSQGRPRRYNRDMARMMAEQAKTGAGIGLPSECYPSDMGGKPMWEIEWPQHVLNLDPIITYTEKLYQQISYGIGVPPELLTSGETGSGYSGRAIPLETFIVGQQRIADALLQLFLAQVLKPLVKWNFGNVPFDATVKPLLETRRDQQGMVDSGKNQRPDQQGGGEQQGSHHPGVPVKPGQHGDPAGAPKPPARPATARLSLNDVGERIKEIARRIRRAA